MNQVVEVVVVLVGALFAGGVGGLLGLEVGRRAGVGCPRCEARAERDEAEEGP